MNYTLLSIFTLLYGKAHLRHIQGTFKAVNVRRLETGMLWRRRRHVMCFEEYRCERLPWCGATNSAEATSHTFHAPNCSDVRDGSAIGKSV